MIGTLRLLKLHGSIDSYWVQGDSSGATINRWDSLGEWMQPVPPNEALRHQVLPGRSPFVVPPAAAKSSFYNNPITRELWQTAAVKLEAADVISLIGYSIPPTDLVASGMLSERVIGRGARVEVVNLEPEPIVRRLQDLGVKESLVEVYEGPQSVQRFVAHLESESSRDIAAEILGALMIVSSWLPLTGPVAVQ